MTGGSYLGKERKGTKDEHFHDDGIVRKEGGRGRRRRSNARGQDPPLEIVGRRRDHFGSSYNVVEFLREIISTEERFGDFY